MSNDLQTQARALGDPTRHAIFVYLANATDAVGVAELTQHFGVNHNAVRQHLAKLVDAELAVESIAAARGRGRPPLEYRLNPTTAERWGAVGPYERLAGLLTEVIRSGDAPAEVGRRAGLDATVSGAAIGAATRDQPGDPLEALLVEMSLAGFQPSLVDDERHDDDHGVIELGNCPFASTAQGSPEVVCELHRGIAIGVAERVGGISIDSLEPHDPTSAGCRLRWHRHGD